MVNLSWQHMTVTYRNYIHVEIASRLNLGYACYRSDYFHFISKNVKIKIHKTIVT